MNASTEATLPTPTAEDLLAYVESRQHVTYAELAGRFAGFEGGDRAMYPGDHENIILWAGMTEPTLRLMADLLASRRLHHHPSSPLVYMIDGRMLNMPLARSARRYRDPHWAPVTLCTFPIEKSRRRKRPA